MRPPCIVDEFRPDPPVGTNIKMIRVSGASGVQHLLLAQSIHQYELSQIPGAFFPAQDGIPGHKPWGKIVGVGG